MTSPIIRIENLVKRFGVVTAVDAVTLDVRANEFLALLGPSGCGKTTLLRMIAGLEQPDAGAVFIAGEDATRMAPYARPVNMMFQSYALFPHMTVAGNVAFGLKQDGLSGAALQERVREALASVEMEGLAGRRPAQLSGGQKQRVALARCIAKRPKALLLDEPLAALDKHLRERTQLELMALRQRLGITFIIVTHDQDEAMAMADRVAVMQAGRILQVGSPRELYNQPATRAVASFFGDVNLWDGTVGANGLVQCAQLPGEVPVAGAPNAGSRVVLALRPEQIALYEQRQAGCCIAATVSEVVYRGTMSTYFLVTAGGAVIRAVRQNTGEDFRRGAQVHLTWPQAAVRVFAP